MKVLHVIDTLWLGGAQQLLKTFFEHQKENNDIFLIALRKTNKYISIDHPNVIVLDIKSKISFKRINQLKSFIKTNNITILHCHLQNSLYHGIKLRKAIPEIKSLFFHDHAVIYDQPGAIKYLVGKNLNNIDGIICCSKASMDKYLAISKKIKSKLHYIPNAIDFDDSTKFKKVEQNDIFTLGFAGRFVKRKGWLDLLQAFSLLKQKQDIKLFMVGDGPDRFKIQRYIFQLKLGNFVEMPGWVDDINDFFDRIDLLVVPSYWEGMPLIVLEAIARKTPIVAYNVDGINEIIKDGVNGFLVEKGDINRLVDFIEKLKIKPDIFVNINNCISDTTISFDASAYIQNIKIIEL